MLKEMLGQLEGLIDTQVTNQCKQLVLGVEAKPYQPLLQRLKCSKWFLLWFMIVLDNYYPGISRVFL